MNENSSIDAALSVLDAHISALNKHDAQALAATLHFPHYRLSGTNLKSWETSDHYFEDFLKRAGTQWKRSTFADIKVVDASDTKVHLDVEVRRFDGNNNLTTRFRSLWVIVEIKGVWAAKFRSSFATQ